MTTYTTHEGLCNSRVWSIYEDHRGTLWIGTASGLCRFSNGRFTRLTTKEGLPGDLVFVLYEDRAGTLWVGTNEGLGRHEAGRWTVFTKKDGLTSDIIRSVRESRDGSIWIGTSGGGLNRLENGRFTSYTTKDGLAGNNVWSIHEDQEAVLWIATYGEGLSRFKDGRFTTYTTQQGLLDDGLSSILEDDEGNLWLGSSKGIFRVSKKELDELAEGKASSLRILALDTADGMKSAECVGGSQPSAWKTQDGRLWFATLRGVVVVDPNRLPLRTRTASVLLDEVLVDRQRVAPNLTHLAPGSQNLEFHYTRPTFLAPQRLRFRYRLDGFDSAWVEAGARRVAYYTSLPPGHYRFRVAAGDEYGAWSEEEASRSFEVKPFFHQTPWFYTLCALALAAVAWGAYRIRLQAIEARYAVLAERNRIAREVHDTLAQGLTGIVLQLQAAERRVAGSHAALPLERARELAQENLKEAQRTVQAMRQDEPGPRALAEALQRFVERMTAGTEVRATLEVFGRPRRLSPEVRQELLRIVQEAFTNALRHSGSPAVRVAVSWSWRRVKIEVSDSGCGFATRPPATGGSTPGLQGMAERAAALKAKLTIVTRPGEGTVVAVEAPVAFWWKGDSA